MITITDIKNNNPKWFTPENKKFFGDISYSILRDREGNIFLIQYTNAWSDMFDGVRKPHYRIHEIDKDLKIGHLFDNTFKTMEEVKTFLKD